MWSSGSPKDIRIDSYTQFPSPLTRIISFLLGTEVTIIFSIVSIESSFRSMFFELKLLSFGLKIYNIKKYKNHIKGKTSSKNIKNNKKNFNYNTKKIKLIIINIKKN